MTSFDHQTSERLAPKDPASLGQDNVVQFDRVFAVQGPHFQRFLSEVVMPVRQDVAIMTLQQLLATASPEDRVFFKDLVFKAFQIADEFCLVAPVTLDSRMKDYFDLYMKRGKVDDILKAAMEAAHDYSLPSLKP